MIYLNIKTITLRAPEYVGCDPTQRATWLNLLAHCCEQENGGRIEGCGDWKDRQWQQTLGVTLEEVRQDCNLWKWGGDSIEIAFYPLDREQEVVAKRDAGKRGGRVRSEVKTQASRDNGAKHNPSITQALTQAEPKQNPSTTQAEPKLEPNKKERKGIKKESKGIGKEGPDPFAPEDSGRADEAVEPLPVCLNTEAFKLAWGEYLAYRRQSKLRQLAPMSVRDQFAEMVGWGHDEAVQAIRLTIRMGWQGIFKPKANGTHNGTTGAARGIRDRKELLYDGTGEW